MSILLDGVNDALTATAPVSGPLMTFGCWFKRGRGTGNNEALMAIGQSGGASTDHFHRIYLNSGSGALVCTTRDTTTSNATHQTGTSDTTTWHLFGGTWATGPVRTPWVDAVAGSTPNTASRSVTAATTMRIGENMASSDDCSGRIAHLAVWNIALTQTDWDALYAGDNPLTVQAANLVWYVPGITDFNDVVGSNHLTSVAFSDAAIDADNPTVDAAPGGAAAPSLFTVRSAIRLGS